MLLTFFVWHLCLGRPLLAIENTVHWQPLNGSRQNSLAVWGRRLILELSFVCSFAQCNKLMNTLGGKKRATLSYTNDKCLFLSIQNVFYYFQVQTSQCWDTAAAVRCSWLWILHAYWMWLPFLFISFHLFMLCFWNDGRHQSVSGSNFKRWGCRKIRQAEIAQAEIAQAEIPTRRQVVNPQSYTQNWFLCRSSSQFGLCIRRGAVMVNSLNWFC